MKTLKRMLAVVLSLAIVLTGVWYGQMKGNKAKAADTTEVATEMLNVKVQVANDGSKVMRFVTTVDSLDYNRVGFVVTSSEGTKTYETRDVFERIVSAPDAGNTKFEFSSKALYLDAQYLATAKFRATEGVDYTVKAFVKTLEGQYVYGKSRCVALSDGAANATTINMSFENTAAAGVKAGDTLTVAYGTANTATTAAVIGVDGTTVHVRVNADATTLKSATKFTFSGVAAGTLIYRNLYTKYTGSGTEDMSWYEVYYAENNAETEFVIATSADLYGFALLTNSKSNALGAMQKFTGKTLYLASDITVNTGNASDFATTKPSYSWTTISQADTNYRFEGTFDGQMHEISGIYINTTVQNTGLFGRTQNATLKNFSLVNSYIKNTNTLTASISVRSWGSTFKNIYSNAIMEVSNQQAGGIVAYSNGITMTNCWFDGVLKSTMTSKPGFGTAGLIGTAYEKTTTLTNCLNTGTISHGNTSYARVAGLIGDNGTGSTVTLTGCLNAGTVTGGYASSIIGVINGGTVTAVNTYAAKNNYVVGYMQNSGKFIVKYPGGQSDQTVSNKSVQNVNIMTYWSSPANFLGEKAKTAMGGVDFTETWMVVSGGTPVLRVFGYKVADWYDDSKDTYVLNTAEELNSFSALTQIESFEGKTVKLGQNIVLNEGNAADYATTAPANVWVPTGTFEGIFDGQGYSISGLYCNRTSQNTGVFGNLGENAVVKNLKLENSYVVSTQTHVGSIAGSSKGDILNVYSDAIVKGPEMTGGIVGLAYTANASLEKAWFDGTVVCTSDGNNQRGIGGIVGLAYFTSEGQTLTLRNCLNSGTVDATLSVANSHPCTGGLIGRIWLSTAGSEVVIDSCLNTGDVINGEGIAAGTSEVVGYCDTKANTMIYKTYAKTESTNNNVDKSGVTIVDAANMKGNAAQTNMPLLGWGTDWKCVEGQFPELNFF